MMIDLNILTEILRDSSITIEHVGQSDQIQVRIKRPHSTGFGYGASLPEALIKATHYVACDYEEQIKEHQRVLGVVAHARKMAREVHQRVLQICNDHDLKLSTDERYVLECRVVAGIFWSLTSFESATLNSVDPVWFGGLADPEIADRELRRLLLDE